MNTTELVASVMQEQDISLLQAALACTGIAVSSDARLQSLRCWISFFDESLSANERLTLHREFADKFTHVAPKYSFHQSPSWPIRVGYLSLSMHELPRKRFVSGLLNLHDPARFSVVLYSQRDQQTWEPHRSVSLAGLDASGIVAAVRADHLDILIDLDGHRDVEFVLALSARLAPIQLSMPHYPGSLGLPTIDYRITDAEFEAEKSHQNHYAEELLRVPCCLNYTVPDRLPEIERTSPHQRNGFVTFGVFGQPLKCGPHFVNRLARILHRSPTARLAFHHPYLGDKARGGQTEVIEAIRHRLLQPFQDAGVSPSRVAFVGALAPWDHLDFHNEVDLILDTAPFSGFTTTLDALVMGVPTLAILGESFVDRTSAGILRHMGLPEFVAENEDQWEELAVRLSMDPQSIPSVRHETRTRFQQSPLTDGHEYTRSIETIYEKLVWRQLLCGACFYS